MQNLRTDARHLPLADASVDAIVTDPPYGLEFMGKTWDRLGDVGARETAKAHPRRDGDDFGGRMAVPAFNDTPNVRCRNCGHWRFSGTPCRCATPDFPNVKAEQGAAMQLWHTEWAREALRVLRPGGHLVAFGAPRTYHRLTCAIEDAGFEIRDSLMWLYGSGFPKSLDVSKAIDRAAGVEREDKFEGSFSRRAGPTGNRKCETCGKWLVSGSPCQCPRPQDEPQSDLARRWEGWGTALKPAYEPIVLARKPLIGTVAANVLAHGTGGLNIDGTRIGMSEQDRDVINSATWHAENLDRGAYGSFERDGQTQQLKAHDGGRWPANLLLDEEAAALLDASTGLTGAFAPVRGDEPSRAGIGEVYGERERVPGSFYGDQGGPSRFFYTAKASREEREAGLLGHLPCIRCGGLDTTEHETERGVAPCRRNPHPTVKPVDLMRWLLTLVTPPGGTVLDPFLGSGTTGVAAGTLGFPFIGADLDEHYLMIARLRMAAERPMMLAL